MKIKNVIKACKQSRNIMVVTVAENERWLGDGSSLWLMPQYIPCTEDGIFGTFDFTESERGKMRYTLTDEKSIGINLADNDDLGEADILDLALTVNGGTYFPIKIESGIIYMKKRYFDIFTDKQFSLKIKLTRDKTPYIAVYEGFLLIGVILPANIETPELCDMLDIIHINMKSVLAEKASE